MTLPRNANDPTLLAYVKEHQEEFEFLNIGANDDITLSLIMDRYHEAKAAIRTLSNREPLLKSLEKTYLDNLENAYRIAIAHFRQKSDAIKVDGPKRLYATRTKPLRKLHPNIDPSHLADKQNGMLLTQGDIDSAIALMKKHQLRRLGKKEWQQYGNGKEKPNFTVIAIYDGNQGKDRYFALYYGQKKKALLGKGGFGSVKLAQDLETKDWFAVKALKILNEHDEIFARQEEKTMRSYDQLAEGEIGEVAIKQVLNKMRGKLEEKRHIDYRLVMDLKTGQSLHTYLEQGPAEITYKNWNIAMQIVSRIDDFQKKTQFAHRDIKPENIMLDINSGKVSLIDFGLAVRLDSVINKMGHNAGTLGYMPPETVTPSHEHTYTLKDADTYAAGVVIGELLGIGKFIERRFVLSDSLDPMGKIALDLVKRMTNEDPYKRPTLEDVKNEIQLILECYVPLNKKIKKVGIINMEELLRLNNEFNPDGENKEWDALVKCMQEMDEIRLINHNPDRSHEDYITLQTLFDNIGARLPDSEYIAMSDAAFADKAITICSAQPTGNCLETYFVITGDKRPIASDIPNNIALLHLDKHDDLTTIINKKQEEIHLNKRQLDYVEHALFQQLVIQFLQIKSHLTNEHAGDSTNKQKRFEHITKTMSHIYEKHMQNDLTLSELKKILNTLEIDLKQTRTNKFFASHAEKKIKILSKQAGLFSAKRSRTTINAPSDPIILKDNKKK